MKTTPRKALFVDSGLFALAVMMAFSNPAIAAEGDLDISFGGTGKVTTNFGGIDNGYGVAVQSNGKIVIAGYSQNFGNYDFAVVRYNADGTLDTGFNGTGKVTTPIGLDIDIATSVAVQSDGKIVAAGFSSENGKNDFAVVRYNVNGSLDTSFGANGKVTTRLGNINGYGEAMSIAIQSDGRIVAAGACTSPFTGSRDFAVVRYNTDGTLDSGFNGTGKVITPIGSSQDTGRTVAVQADGKILVGGETRIGSNSDFALVRYNTNGSLDTSFNGSGKVTVDFGLADTGNSVAVQSDGKIVVAGSTGTSSMISDFALVRFNTDGSLDLTFNGTGKVTTDIGGSLDFGNSMALGSGGKIVVAGVFGSNQDDSTYDFALLRYEADGTLDTSFNGTGKVTTAIGNNKDGATSVAVQNDGRIVVAGYSDNGNDDFAVARYEAVPEPATCAILALGVVAILGCYRSRFVVT